ncbi:MAG: sugar nucleotide-binding protein [Clostridia bacterium]|nr:sugar nucleotide-binding protein [Clostridia bacterium]
MTILVTGASGFVGSRIMALFKDAVPAPSLRDADEARIAEIVDAVRPDVILHTAAISDIPTCEQHPEASYRANVLTPAALARAAQGAKLVMFSSDQVYGGSPNEGPFAEGDERPVNVYARHKLEMERRVLDIAPDAVMLRATWMYDMPLYGADNRGNFLINTLRAAITHTPLSYRRTEYRGITYVREVAKLTRRAVDLPGGVYNFGSENSMSMYDTALFLSNALGLDAPKVEPSGRHNLWMDCGKLRSHGISFSQTAEGLTRCIDDYGLKALCGC